MKKYYIGLAALLVLTLGLAGFTINLGGAAKRDKETAKKFESIAGKLNDQSGLSSQIPGDMEDIGVDDVPPSITYKKLDSEKYRLCVTFEQSSNVFDAGWFALFGGITPQTTEDSDDEPRSYVDTFIVYSHEKGENCQTVQPYSFNSEFNFDELDSSQDLQFDEYYNTEQQEI